MSPKLLLFILFAMVVLVGESMSRPDLVAGAKPLLMPALMVWFYSVSQDIPSRLRNAWLLGLGFSTIGDILLLFAKGNKGEMFFILGLSAFLLAHLCYIHVLWQKSGKKLDFLKEMPIIIAIPAIYYVLLMLWILSGVPNAIKPPVMVYGLVICSMLLGVINLFRRIDQPTFRWLVAGAILFILSDSLIALNKFAMPIPAAGFLIMSTYIVGQWMLANGISKNENHNKNV